MAVQRVTICKVVDWERWLTFSCPRGVKIFCEKFAWAVQYHHGENGEAILGMTAQGITVSINAQVIEKTKEHVVGSVSNGETTFTRSGLEIKSMLEKYTKSWNYR